MWGDAFRFATRFRTADFSQPDTYTTFTQYAPCFYYGCAETCLPEQRDFNVTVAAVRGPDERRLVRAGSARSMLPRAIRPPSIRPRRSRLRATRLIYLHAHNKNIYTRVTLFPPCRKQGFVFHPAI